MWIHYYLCVFYKVCVCTQTTPGTFLCTLYSKHTSHWSLKPIPSLDRRVKSPGLYQHHTALLLMYIRTAVERWMVCSNFSAVKSEFGGWISPHPCLLSYTLLIHCTRSWKKKKRRLWHFPCHPWQPLRAYHSVKGEFLWEMLPTSLLPRCSE